MKILKCCSQHDMILAQLLLLKSPYVPGYCPSINHAFFQNWHLLIIYVIHLPLWGGGGGHIYAVGKYLLSAY